MAVLLTLLVESGRAEARRELAITPGTSILKAAHAAGVDVTATCGGRGRCTSCRVKFVAGTVPPPTIGDEVQLGDALVREGYRLACQCLPIESVTVELAPPLEETLVPDPRRRPRPWPAAWRSTPGSTSSSVKVALPREEHHQTSDVEQLAAAIGVAAADVPAGVLTELPQALRDDPAGATVTTFAGRILSVERGDTTLHALRPGHRHRHHQRGDHPAWSSASGEQLASVSSLNPQAVFGGDLMSRIAFAQFDAGNLRKLHTRIVGPAQPAHGEVVPAVRRARQVDLQGRWSSATPACTTSCSASTRPTSAWRPMRPSCAMPLVAARARAVPEAGAGGPRLPAAARGRLRGRRRRRGGAGHPHLRGPRRCASRSTSAPTARCCWARRGGCGRARRRRGPRSRARQIRHGMRGAARRHRPRRRSTTTCTCTRSARRPRWGSAARVCSTWSPACSTRA